MDTLRKALWAVIKRFSVAVLSTLGIVTLFGYLLNKLELMVHTRLYSLIGSGAVLFTAIIGTPLHETSHWLGCKLFGFNVSEVQLLRPIKYKQDGILGLVSFTYSSDSWWQKLGCALVGFAPMILGSAFILLTILLLKPEIFQKIKERVAKVDSDKRDNHFFASLWAGFTGFWAGLFSLKKLGWLRGIMCLYISGSIAMHMTLSEQDIKSAAPGIAVVAIIYLIFAIVTALIGTDYVVPGAKVATYISAFMSIGLFADALLLGITILWGGVGNFKGVSSHINSINLDKYVVVSESGYNHYGQVTVSFDEEKFEKKYAKKFVKYYLNDGMSFGGENSELFSGYQKENGLITLPVTMWFSPTVENNSHLSNGDKIIITWEKPEFIDISGTELGIRFKYSDIEYTVEKLKTVEEYNPFEGVSVSFSGLSGTGNASIELSESVSNMEGLSFAFSSNYSGLSNGDEVTVTCNISDIDIFADQYSKLPSKYEQTYIVEKLPTAISSVSELPDSVIEKINAIALETIDSMDDTWVESCHIDSVENAGTVLLYDDQFNYEKYNKLYMIYKVIAKGELTPTLDLEYYVAVTFANFINDNGNITYGDGPGVPTHSFIKKGYKNSDGKYYASISFSGYETIDEIIKEVSSPYTGYSHYENNIEE